MSDELATTQEIPLDQDDTARETDAIDRDGEPRVSPQRGAALSVLWWEEDARLPAS
ncbi:MAG: hypothetical protein KF850_37205 [Labilithrix sp.]|nr:hypothetical protein [Labilithrix sp.]